MSPPSKGLDRRWLFGCLGLAAALRLFRIGHQSLWIDETISLQLATWTTGGAFWKGLLQDIHGPWSSMLLHGWVAFGRGEAWLRLLYAIPAIATVPLVYRFTQNLLGERAGKITCLAMAVSPFHVWYSQEIRSYSWAILWVSAALLLFSRVWDGRGGRGTWLGLGACLALGALSNFSVAFLFAALALLALARRPFDRRFVLAAGGTLVGASLVFVPWFVDWFTRLAAERLFVSAPAPLGVELREAAGFSLAGLPYSFWTFAFGYTLGPTLLDLHLDRSRAALSAHWPVIAVGMLAVGVTAVQGFREALARRRGAWIVAIAGVPLLLATVLAVRGVKTFHPRYLMVSFPVFLACLGAGWARGGLVARVTGVAALTLAVVSLTNLYFNEAYAKEDSRSAAQHVLARATPGDSVVVIYASRPFEYYFVDEGRGTTRLLHVHKRFLQSDDQMRVHVADARKGSDRVWLILSRWWDVAPEDRIRRIFEETLDETAYWEFHGVKVLLYEGRSA